MPIIEDVKVGWASHFKNKEGFWRSGKFHLFIEGVSVCKKKYTVREDAILLATYYLDEWDCCKECWRKFKKGVLNGKTKKD